MFPTIQKSQGVPTCGFSIQQPSIAQSATNLSISRQQRPTMKGKLYMKNVTFFNKR